ncbi:hypothetical protein [Mycolicibacter kumamotonensis]|nr:hypothetical protein [Mycolicibacter kumamotonensis]
MTDPASRPETDDARHAQNELAESRTEVERLRGALDGLMEDCDAEILYDRAPQVAQAIRNILREHA